ncbi:MAG: CAP domain-containing protein [Planctomycetales bacterium]|nr:CAP domain-containing protein [Planctomycetales bacterium]
MRRAAAVGLLLGSALAAATGQEPGAPAAPADPADLLRRALGRGDVAMEAAAALRALPREGLAPIADEIVRRLSRARDAALAERGERIREAGGALGGGVRKRLHDAREAAKRLIRSNAYTKERQPEVDRLVGDVRTLFHSPFPAEALDSPRLREELGRWSLLRDLATRAAGEKAGGLDPDAEVAALDRREIPKLWLSSSQEEALESVQKEHRDFLDPEECACIEATNRYRAMMGLMPDQVDRKLVVAARKHCEEMQRLGYFAHESPVPDHRTPGQRAGKEGTSCGSENIAAGQSRGEGAFDGWYHSPGHHRNILGSHGRTGVGRHGTLWTQMFG